MGGVEKSTAAVAFQRSGVGNVGGGWQLRAGVVQSRAVGSSGGSMALRSAREVLDSTRREAR